MVNFNKKLSAMMANNCVFEIEHSEVNAQMKNPPRICRRKYSSEKISQKHTTLSSSYVIIIIFITAILSVKIVHSAPAASSKTEKLCGAKLVDALRFICDGRGIYTPRVSGTCYYCEILLPCLNS